MNYLIDMETLNWFARFIIFVVVKKYLNLRKTIIKENDYSKIINYLDNSINIMAAISKLNIFDKNLRHSIKRMTKKKRNYFQKILHNNQEVDFLFKELNFFYNLVKYKQLQNRTYYKLLFNAIISPERKINIAMSKQDREELRLNFVNKNKYFYCDYEKYANKYNV